MRNILPRAFSEHVRHLFFYITTPAQFEWKDISGKVRSSVKPPNVKMSKKERKEVQKVQNTQGNLDPKIANS